ncbi:MULTISPECIES: ComF family protein [Cellulophaga]|uniref:Phosphoribosyltransferase n=2 Tax=Cellulophaga TaxID=104264 RepID=F0REW8_CELLC|nr:MULTISPECIES: phosphoribosyltransferase family protein [Cellulophaga]ADY28923.1 phosphoribosyltransferase [Cellulophaga lytica DSM 7489]AIM59969.1 amidophosphoribosyltransferase [Cellulophaga lytica]APU09842.1 amidophosphoribosyltransferase [Cellulophaga lytica]EWH13299.1 phosphoribosyltransferase [Cellulophaga geojensis KL-A]MDO6854440.1 phosphoribosyltransferase family protein [Cellulophaga lytica]
MPLGCFGCNTPLRKGERLICTVCRNELPLTEYNFTDENPIDRVFYGRINVKKVNSFLFFTKNGVVKNIIHHLKYKNQQQLGTFFGRWYAQSIKERLDIDIVVPVPLHKKKLTKRGYNQVSLFGQELALHFNASYQENVLFKTANTRTLTKKNRFSRWKVNQDLYKLTNEENVAGKTILLVDDVITTGATIEACATALHKAKNVTIYVATIAVVP